MPLHKPQRLSVESSSEIQVPFLYYTLNRPNCVIRLEYYHQNRKFRFVPRCWPHPLSAKPNQPESPIYSQQDYSQGCPPARPATRMEVPNTLPNTESPHERTSFSKEIQTIPEQYQLGYCSSRSARREGCSLLNRKNVPFGGRLHWQLLITDWCWEVF